MTTTQNDTAPPHHSEHTTATPQPSAEPIPLNHHPDEVETNRKQPTNEESTPHPSVAPETLSPSVTLAPSPNQLVESTLRAATDAATAVIKEELPSFIPSNNTYPTNPSDVLKQQPNPVEPPFAEHPQLDTATVLANPMNDHSHSHSHQPVASDTSTHEKMTLHDASGNILPSFSDPTDTVISPSHIPHQSPHPEPVNLPSTQHTTHMQEDQSQPLDGITLDSQNQPFSAPQQHHDMPLHAAPAQIPTHVPAHVTDQSLLPHQQNDSVLPLSTLSSRMSNPLASNSLNGALQKKPGRMPGTKQCPTCHSTIAAALAKCTKCHHVFREKKEKIKRSGKRGKKNCPKCNFENPSACSSCKTCKYVFRLKLIDKYKQMRPRQTEDASNAVAAAAHAAAAMPHVQGSTAPAVATVPLPAGVASYPGHIGPGLHPAHTVSVIPPLSQHQLAMHQHNHNVHTSGIPQIYPIPQHPMPHHQSHPQL